MTIRTRLTLWFGGILFVALAATSALSYYELVAEPRSKVQRGDATADGELQDNGPEDAIAVLVWCGIPALILGLGGGLWMMRKAMAPVSALTQAAQGLNENNLGRRLPTSGNGEELDRLTEVFNGMSQRLNQAFSRVREFTLHASHELKTPLTVLRGEMENALQDKDLAPAHRARTESQLEEIDRLARIVDGLSLLTRADAGLVRVCLGPVSLTDLVRENYADTQILARQAKLGVDLEACEEATIEGDPKRLRQMLLNLADNAVKYNQPGGSISMTLRHVADQVQFSISNTGPGIPAEMLPRVFDRFFRGDSSHGREVEGCGLGLSIAEWIVSVHNGTVRIESVPAKLTTVIVSFPQLLRKPEPA